MGRPSNLDTRQWAEIGRRVAMGGAGNSMGDLAAEFGISKSSISRRFSQRIETVQVLAKTLATTERAIEALPVAEQCSIRSLADQLKVISGGLAKAAGHGANISARLSEIADRHLESLGDSVLDPNNDVAQDGVKQVMKLATVANETSRLGMGLLQANKSKADAGMPTLEDLVTGGKQ